MSSSSLLSTVLAVAIIIAGAPAAVSAVVWQPCRVRDLQAGKDATCMVLDTPADTVPAGAAMCFGSWVQLGAGVTVSSAAPLPVFGLSSAGANVQTMEAATSGSCGVFVGPSGWRQLRCSGNNVEGQLGCGTTGGSYQNSWETTPCDAVGLPGPSSSTQVNGATNGDTHTVAWLADGRVFAAGQQPFNGQGSKTASFTQVSGLSDVASCAAGQGHTCCLIKTSGTVRCWGSNTLGQLGDGTSASTSTPVQVQGGLSGVVQLVAGASYTAALLQNGTVRSWGFNFNGQLGDDTQTNRRTPVSAVNLSDVAQISAGGSTSCALLTNGDLRCWGLNLDGQVGTNCGLRCLTPQAPVLGVSSVASVAVGSNHVCVVRQDKSASCWGNGFEGQLSGTKTDAASPGRVVMCQAPGCPASPPTGSTTSIASYQSCSTTASAGLHSQDTACTATCAAGSSGGFAKCGLSAAGAPVWQVTPCTADCSSTGLPAVPNAVWNCAASVIAGGSCSGSCAAGFDGRLTAVCAGPSWSTTGDCTRAACISPPPIAPNATFQCASSTPVGQPCVAVCAAGLSGSPRRVCLANGTWGALEGDACVDCGANQPKLTANQPSISVEAGSAVVSANFTFTAPFVKGTTNLLAALDGLTACTTQPAQLTGAIATPRGITVSCQVAGGGISAGPHKLALTATATGSNGCSSGSATSRADILATSAPTPAPSVQLAAAGAAPSACKAADGKPTSVSAIFTYSVAPAASGGGGLILETEVASTAAGAAACTATRSGGLEGGVLEVTCRGVLDGLTSLGITIILKASTPGSLEGSATSSHTVAFVCCTAASTLAHAVNTSAGSSCQTCGNASAVDGVWLRGGLQAGVMRAGDISASTCSSANSADVGTMTTACDAQNSKLLYVTITNPASSTAAKIEFLARCNIETVTPDMPSFCTAQGSYSWRTVTPRLNSLNVTSGPLGERILRFGILLTSTQATCTCRTSFYAIKQTGAFSTGRPVSSSGSCPAASGARPVKAKAVKNKAKDVAGLSGRRLF